MFKSFLQTGKFMPTALIPFCSFSDNFTLMGVPKLNFNVPVCNSFSPKVVNDQLCYTADPNQNIKDKNVLNNFLYMGKELSITLYIDYNKDRHLGKMNNLEFQHVKLDTLGRINQYMFIV